MRIVFKVNDTKLFHIYSDTIPNKKSLISYKGKMYKPTHFIWDFKKDKVTIKLKEK